MYLCLCLHLCVSMEIIVRCQVSCSITLHLLLLSLIEPGVQKSQVIHISATAPRVGVTGRHAWTYTTFYVDSGDLNMGPHICRTNALTCHCHLLSFSCWFWSAEHPFTHWIISSMSVTNTISSIFRGLIWNLRNSILCNSINLIIQFYITTLTGLHYSLVM